MPGADSAAALRPFVGQLRSVNESVDKVLGQLNGQVLDKVAALNSSFSLRAFSIGSPLAAQAKASFDDYTRGVFKLLEAWQAQGEKIRGKTSRKTEEVLSQFGAQFASQVNEAMEAERKNWKAEAGQKLKRQQRDAAEKLQQTRAAAASEVRAASRGDPIGGLDDAAAQQDGGARAELAKRAARIKQLEEVVLAAEVQHLEDEEVVSVLRQNNRELSRDAAALEEAQAGLAEAQAKLKEQDTLIGDYLAELRDKERKAQKNISAPSEVRPTRRQKPPRRAVLDSQTFCVQSLIPSGYWRQSWVRCMLQP